MLDTMGIDPSIRGFVLDKLMPHTRQRALASWQLASQALVDGGRSAVLELVFNLQIECVFGDEFIGPIWAFNAYTISFLQILWVVFSSPWFSCLA